jgi:hypothetical protein
MGLERSVSFGGGSCPPPSFLDCRLEVVLHFMLLFFGVIDMEVWPM